MKTVQLSELGALAEDVRKGETIDVLDGEKHVARLVPDQAELLEYLDRMEAEGKIFRGKGKLPPDFFTRPRPKLEGGSLLEELLKEREESPW